MTVSASKELTLNDGVMVSEFSTSRKFTVLSFFSSEFQLIFEVDLQGVILLHVILTFEDG